MCQLDHEGSGLINRLVLDAFIIWWYHWLCWNVGGGVSLGSGSLWSRLSLRLYLGLAPDVVHVSLHSVFCDVSCFTIPFPVDGLKSLKSWFEIIYYVVSIMSLIMAMRKVTDISSVQSGSFHSVDAILKIWHEFSLRLLSGDSKSQLGNNHRE